MLSVAALSQPCSSRFAAALASALRPAFRPFSSSRQVGQEKAAQPQTPATEHIELSAPATYISESHDPWFNLSYEDWLLRNTPHDQPVLFLYRNFPCVVIGRNQASRAHSSSVGKAFNPWKETTPRKLHEAGTPLVRRRSGGGTVYHDLGNTNFSIILPRLLFTRAHGAELVARAIRDRLGIDTCGVNKRNDVVSGSAYKIVQHRAYHHGTMLISSSLSELGRSLKSSSPGIETKGIASFPSPVTTLNAYRPSSRPHPIKHDDFTDAVIHEFGRVYAGKNKPMQTIEIDEGRVKEAKVWDGVRELKSWEWTFGQTPEFSNDFEGDLSFGKVSVSLTSRHALLTSITFHLSPAFTFSTADTQTHQSFLDALALSLVGRRYETLDGAESPEGEWEEDPKWMELAAEVIAWLRHTM
ncbi:hypothetical protein JCM24511_04487 [Saitozyma sp. JCM 24511]|nr:hypothetical protein JCM24511_04487 [Saitozyma sp. JCM 24511]